MNQKVVIKSNKYGLIVHMDPEAEYKQILEELRTSFTESAKFLKMQAWRLPLRGECLPSRRKKKS